MKAPPPPPKPSTFKPMPPGADVINLDPPAKAPAKNMPVKSRPPPPPPPPQEAPLPPPASAAGLSSTSSNESAETASLSSADGQSRGDACAVP